MKNYHFLILLSIFSFSACVPLDQTTGSGGGNSNNGSGSYPVPLVLANRVYKPGIQSVQIYPFTNESGASLAPAAVSLQGPPLILKFDELKPDFEQYNVRLVHCTWNWEQSALSTLQYLNSYNEFPVTGYDFSQNTIIPYVHYNFTVPRVKIPGNYVLVVYRNNSPDDIVLSRRFIVYNPRTRINIEQKLPAGPAERRENQQIDFTLNYGGLGNVIDPASQFKIVIKQNQRWDNAMAGLKPTGIREGLQEIEYEPFDKTNQFKGGNEYRFFDLRMVQARGQNVDRVYRDSTGYQAFLVVNKPFTGLAYTSIDDLNGQYVITSMEYPEPATSAEYVNVHFFLKTESRLPHPVYIGGELSSYLPVPPYLMSYDPELGGYLTDLLLKQGWYNYMFLLQGAPNPYLLEGSFAETENLYEIIVYFRPAGEIYDEIVGYAAFKKGNQR